MQTVATTNAFLSDELQTAMKSETSIRNFNVSHYLWLRNALTSFLEEKFCFTNRKSFRQTCASIGQNLLILIIVFLIP